MKPLSDRIADVLAASLRGNGQGDDPYPMLSEITAALGKRSFGIVLVLFGLPNLLPIPGLPILCGIVVGVVAFQMVLGKQSLALPGWLGGRRIKRSDLQKVVERAEPVLRRLEKVMRPRFEQLTGQAAQRTLGVILLLLALALLAPIPFFGGIPPGIAVTLIGLGMTERDGIFIILGAIATIGALIFSAALTYAIVKQIVLFVLAVIGIA